MSSSHLTPMGHGDFDLRGSVALCELLCHSIPSWNQHFWFYNLKQFFMKDCEALPVTLLEARDLEDLVNCRISKPLHGKFPVAGT